MPLNHKTGEVIEGLGREFRVVPNEKWRESKLFDDAANSAAAAFLKAGALWPILFDDEEVVTQEYPNDNRLVIVFLKKIKGEDVLYPFVWELPPEMTAELSALGKWDSDRIQQEA
jgi:hypothetical protein